MKRLFSGNLLLHITSIAIWNKPREEEEVEEEEKELVCKLSTILFEFSYNNNM